MPSSTIITDAIDAILILVITYIIIGPMIAWIRVMGNSLLSVDNEADNNEADNNEADNNEAADNEAADNEAADNEADNNNNEADNNDNNDNKNLLKKIKNVENVVYQLLGGLFNQTTQDEILTSHLNRLLDLNLKPTFTNEEKNIWPTTRQGDDHEIQLNELTKLIQKQQEQINALTALLSPSP
jgi:hypothetical protein